MAKRTSNGRATTKKRRRAPARDGSTTPEIFTASSLDRAFVAEADVLRPDVDRATGQRVFETRAGFLEALVRGDSRVTDLFAAHLSASPPPPDFDELIHFVRTVLGLPWPWLVVALLETYHRMLQLKIGDPVKALPPAGEADVLAPRFQLGFGTLEGESTGEARERLAAVFDEAVALLDEADVLAAGAGKHRAPKRDTQYLRDGGRWFYEARVQRPPRTIMAIAREHHEAARHPGTFEDHDPRKDVREAITRASHLLNLDAYDFPQRGGGNNTRRKRP